MRYRLLRVKDCFPPSTPGWWEMDMQWNLLLCFKSIQLYGARKSLSPLYPNNNPPLAWNFGSEFTLTSNQQSVSLWHTKRKLWHVADTRVCISIPKLFKNTYNVLYCLHPAVKTFSISHPERTSDPWWTTKYLPDLFNPVKDSTTLGLIKIGWTLYNPQYTTHISLYESRKKFWIFCLYDVLWTATRTQWISLIHVEIMSKSDYFFHLIKQSAVRNSTKHESFRK